MRKKTFTGGKVMQPDPHAYVIENIQKQDQAIEQAQQKQKQHQQEHHDQQISEQKQKEHDQQISDEKQKKHDQQISEQKQKQKINIFMKKIYYNDLNFDGIVELFRKAKIINKDITRDEVSKWLKSQAVYQQTIERPKIQMPENLPIYTNDPYSFQIDLTFLPKYKEQNDGNYVLFTAINIDTRFSYASYGKDKKGATIINMLNDFLKNALIIHSITSDSGSEFTSKDSKEWFEKNNIKTYFWTGDSHRLGIINRFHRTLKQKLLKYMISTDSTRWIDIMSNLILNLNHTYNRGIKMTPYDASNPMLTSQIILDAIEKTTKIHNIEPLFKIGDLVRVMKKKKLFNKQDTNYSDQVLTITKVNKNTVTIEDDKGHEYSNVKKKWLLVIDGVENFVENIEKKAVEKSHQISEKIKKIGIERNDDKSELVSAVKGRERKQKIIYNV